jgi:hypothetical protein
MTIDPKLASVRFSNLKQIARSPLHYYAAVQGGSREPTLSMRIGTGAHALLFGRPPTIIYRGGEFTPAGAKKAKTYTDVKNGACWEDFKARHEGKVILSETEHAKSSAMVRALHTHAVADSLLFADGTLHEHRIEWLLGGRRCSGTLDALGPAAVIDLKSAQDAGPDRFPFQARKMAYHSQAIWYADGAELAGHGERVPFLVAVENSAPFAVQVYRLTDSDIRDGRRLYNEWLDVVLRCEEAGDWPAYSDAVLPLNVLNLPPLPEDDEDTSEDEGSDDVAA